MKKEFKTEIINMILSLIKSFPNIFRLQIFVIFKKIENYKGTHNFV